jgi:hypothetical protein
MRVTNFSFGGGIGMTKLFVTGVCAVGVALSLAAPAAAQSNYDAPAGSPVETAAGTITKEVGAHSLNMVAKYLCKDPTGTTSVIGISVADLQGSGDAWRIIASVGTGSKIETNTNYQTPNTSGTPSSRAPVLAVNVFPADRTVAGKTALVLGTPANDIPAGFTFPTFSATGLLRITYNGGGPACARKAVVQGTAQP